VIAATCLGNSFKVHLAILLLTLCTLGGKKSRKRKEKPKMGKKSTLLLAHTVSPTGYLSAVCWLLQSHLFSQTIRP
jgi:hypothetical protein